MSNRDFQDFFNKGSFDPDEFLSRNKNLILLVLASILFLPNAVVMVGAGQKGVIFNRITGMEQRSLEEGVQFVIPFVEAASLYNVREINYIFSDKSERSTSSAIIVGNSIHTLTSDGQNISIDVTVRARPDFGELWWLHQNLGNDDYNSYVEKVLTPIVESSVREVISGYTVSAIYSEDRRAIANSISAMLREKLSKFKIVLSEFLLDEVTFSDAYQTSIEEKQKARIELDTKDNIIVEEMNKRDAIITKAAGEAEAIRLKVDALNRNPDYVKFRKAQIYGKRANLIIEDSL
jgi:regulator of protease activity HflC (stomatin/prohibitin superfamily)